MYSPLSWIFPFIAKLSIFQPHKRFYTNLDNWKKLIRGVVNNLKDEHSVVYKLLHTQGITKEEILCDVPFFYFAGLDTTVHLMSSCLFHLSKYPDVRMKLMSEIHNTGFSDGMGITNAYSLHNIDKMEYLTYFIKETLRLDPTAISSGRYMAYQDTEI